MQPHLPHEVLDAVLSAVEQALSEVGATRVWLAHDAGGFAVRAELPDEPRSAS